MSSSVALLFLHSYMHIFWKMQKSLAWYSMSNDNMFASILNDCYHKTDFLMHHFSALINAKSSESYYEHLKQEDGFILFL